MSKFVDDVLAGRAQPSSIYDYIDRWHVEDDGEGVALHEYLGLSGDQYSRWIEHSDCLDAILGEIRAAKFTQENSRRTKQ